MLEVAIASFELALHPPKGDLEFEEKAATPKQDTPEETPPSENNNKEDTDA